MDGLRQKIDQLTPVAYAICRALQQEVSRLGFAEGAVSVGNPERAVCRLTAILLGLFVSLTATADPLRVAVASNFLTPAKTLAARFETLHGTEVSLSAGSTGKLYAQIVNGAPFGLFLAANAREPERLEAAGLAVAGSRFTYATGRLVLWSADAELLRDTDRAELLRSGDFDRLAIANPKTAPYGSAAMQVLKHLGITPGTLKGRLIRAENVSQTYQFIASGNVALGFVALSQIRSPERVGRGSYWLVPADLHAPIAQQAVLLSRAADDADTKAFLDFLRSVEGQALIGSFGYGQE